MAYPKQLSTVHVETLNDELCIYDWQSKQVHALNPTAAKVWQLCDGQTSPAQMATLLSTQLGVKLDPIQTNALVWKSLKELEKAHLLEGEVAQPAGQTLLSRRQMLKMGLAVALLPVISSILAPTAVEAQSPGSRLVLYAANNSATFNGNLGGRAGADALCAGSANKPAGYSHFRAFISVSATDEIQDMPANYLVPTTLPIVGPNGTQLASNWANLLDGNIDATLLAAGINMAASAGSWWSGSTEFGAVNGTGTCGGWTSSLSLVAAFYGANNSTTAGWLNNGNWTCNNLSAVMCIAF